MNRTAKLPLPEEARRIETLAASNAVLEDRVARLELYVGKICAALGVDPLPPRLGAEWTTIKGAAADSHFSESYIRKLIARGRISAVMRGGRVLVRKDSIPLPSAIKRLA